MEWKDYPTEEGVHWMIDREGKKHCVLVSKEGGPRPAFYYRDFSGGMYRVKARCAWMGPYAAPESADEEDED